MTNYRIHSQKIQDSILNYKGGIKDETKHRSWNWSDIINNNVSSICIVWLQDVYDGISVGKHRMAQQDSWSDIHNLISSNNHCQLHPHDPNTHEKISFKYFKQYKRKKDEKIRNISNFGNLYCSF